MSFNINQIAMNTTQSSTPESCLGSIASMFILQHQAGDFALALCASVTMACNAIFIAQAPAKWCVGSFYLSMIVNTLFVLFFNI